MAMLFKIWLAIAVSLGFFNICQAQKARQKHKDLTFTTVNGGKTAIIDSVIAFGDFEMGQMERPDFVRFRREVNFSHATFLKPADFSSASFYDNAFFNGSKFKQEADFHHADFFKAADFSNDTFSNFADFSNLTPEDSTEFFFEKCILPDSIDFSHNTKITNEINLMHCNFKSAGHYDGVKDRYFKKHIINLHASDVSKFKFEYRYFTLDLHNLSRDEKASVYEELLKNFQDHGQTESYKLLDIEYQEFSHPAIAWLGRMWWNWGYNKEYVFYWTLIFITFFTIITYIFYFYMSANVYNVSNLQEVPAGHNLARLWCSFIYTLGIFFRFSLKTEKINFRYKLGVLYIFLVNLLGILCLAYMANFVLGK